MQVNGVSLVGVSQKLAAETLSSCAINPDTGLVQFLVARQGEPCLFPAFLGWIPIRIQGFMTNN